MTVYTFKDKKSIAPKTVPDQKLTNNFKDVLEKSRNKISNIQQNKNTGNYVEQIILNRIPSKIIAK